MVRIFLVGAGGVGKTTLMKDYMRMSSSCEVSSFGIITEVARCYMKEQGISQQDLKNRSIFWDLQVNIAKRQLDNERKMDDRGKHYISDRCIVDAIVYASLCIPDRFPSLMKELKWDIQARSQAGLENEECIDELLTPIIEDSKVAQEVVRRYRNSLIVIVQPFDQKAANNDGVRMLMDPMQLIDYTQRCRAALRLLGIPFVELMESDRAARVNVLQQAISDLSGPLKK